MLWLRDAVAVAAGFAAAATFLAALAFAAYRATVLYDALTIDPRDDPIFGSAMYFAGTWPFWLLPVLGASGWIGFIAGRSVHKILSARFHSVASSPD
jgi:hypothetical protein